MRSSTSRVCVCVLSLFASVGQVVGFVVPSVPAVAAHMPEPEVIVRLIAQGSPSRPRFHCQSLVCLGLPAARGNHSCVARVVSHADWLVWCRFSAGPLQGSCEGNELARVVCTRGDVWCGSVHRPTHLQEALSILVLMAAATPDRCRSPSCRGEELA